MTQQRISRGFSLIEIIIGLALILVTVTIFGVAVNTVPLTKTARNQNLAYHIAAKKIEELRNTPYTSLPSSGSFTDPGFINLPGGTGSISIVNYQGSSDIKRVVTTVNWIQGTSNKNLSLETLIRNPGPPAAPPVLVNNYVTVVPLTGTYSTTSDTTGCGAGFVGKFSFDSRLTNKVTSPSLSNLYYRVTTLTNGNLLQNADGGPGGVGSILTIPNLGSYADNVLSPGELVDAQIIICLQQSGPFNFIMDVYGVVGS